MVYVYVSDKTWGLILRIDNDDHCAHIGAFFYDIWDVYEQSSA